MEGADGLVPMGATVLSGDSLPILTTGRRIAGAAGLLKWTSVAGRVGGWAGVIAGSVREAQRTWARFGGNGPESYARGEAPLKLEGPP